MQDIFKHLSLSVLSITTENIKTGKNNKICNIPNWIRGSFRHIYMAGRTSGFSVRRHTKSRKSSMFDRAAVQGYTDTCVDLFHENYIFHVMIALWFHL